MLEIKGPDQGTRLDRSNSNSVAPPVGGRISGGRVACVTE